MQSLQKYYHVDKKNISLLRFFFEACDGIAAISTIAAKDGIIKFYIPPGCEADVDMIINALGKQMNIIQIEEPLV